MLVIEKEGWSTPSFFFSYEVKPLLWNPIPKNFFALKVKAKDLLVGIESQQISDLYP